MLNKEGIVYIVVQYTVTQPITHEHRGTIAWNGLSYLLDQARYAHHPTYVPM